MAPLELANSGPNQNQDDFLWNSGTLEPWVEELDPSRFCLSTVPFEIIEYITDRINDSLPANEVKTALQNASLIRKSWTIPCQKHLFSHSILGTRRDTGTDNDRLDYLQRRVDFLQNDATHLYTYCTRLEIWDFNIPKGLRVAFSHITHLVFLLKGQRWIDWRRISSITNEYRNLQQVELPMPTFFIPTAASGSIALDPHVIRPHSLALHGHADHIALLLGNDSTIWNLASISILELAWNSHSRDLDAVFTRLHRFPALRQLTILPSTQTQFSANTFNCPALTSLRIALPLTVEWSQDKWSEQPEECENAVIERIRECFRDCTLPQLRRLYLDFQILYAEVWIQLVPAAVQAYVSARGSIIPGTVAQQLQKLAVSFDYVVEGPFAPEPHIEVRQIEDFCTLFGVPDQAKVVGVLLGKGINEPESEFAFLL